MSERSKLLRLRQEGRSVCRRVLRRLVEVERLHLTILRTMHLFFELSLCLSRACLDKVIICSIK